MDSCLGSRLRHIGSQMPCNVIFLWYWESRGSRRLSVLMSNLAAIRWPVWGLVTLHTWCPVFPICTAGLCSGPIGDQFCQPFRACTAAFLRESNPVCRWSEQRNKLKEIICVFWLWKWHTTIAGSLEKYRNIHLKKWKPPHNYAIGRELFLMKAYNKLIQCYIILY